MANKPKLQEFDYTVAGTANEKPTEGVVKASDEADAMAQLKAIYGEHGITIKVGSLTHSKPIKKGK
jgi:hypothetical protein